MLLYYLTFEFRISPCIDTNMISVCSTVPALFPGLFNMCFSPHIPRDLRKHAQLSTHNIRMCSDKTNGCGGDYAFLVIQPLIANVAESVGATLDGISICTCTIS